MQGFLEWLGGLMVAGGFACLIFAIVLTVVQYFSSLDPDQLIGGAAGFVLPITTAIAIIIFAFTQPDKMFMPTTFTIVGVLLIIFGAPLAG